MPYATEFTQFNPRCSGKFVVPFGCSGLVILSKYPIEFAGIRPFRYALCSEKKSAINNLIIKLSN